MKLFITGGCGFLGSNLAAHAIELGMELSVFDNLSRDGSSFNLEWLRALGNLEFIHGDIRNAFEVERAINRVKPDAVFHLAGQVAMTKSISHPRIDFEVNCLGSLNLLEAVRLYAKDAKLIYSSTNKVYGDLEQFDYAENDLRYICIDHPDGFDENVPLNFSSPYGCSKGAADQYFVDYHRIFGLNTTVFRHSSMYGGRQFATEDQGWLGWFCKVAALRSKGQWLDEVTISGSGKQVRDVLHARDMVKLYFSALESDKTIAGEVFNIGGGIENSLSLLELFQLLESFSGESIAFRKLPPRESDQRVFVANIGKAQEMIGWYPEVSTDVGVSEMLDWVGSL